MLGYISLVGRRCFLLARFLSDISRRYFWLVGAVTDDIYLSLSLGNNSGSAFCRRVAPCGVSRNKSRVIRSLCHVVDDKFSSIDWQPAAGNAISLSRKKLKSLISDGNTIMNVWAV